ncbi:alpha/beta hydrolase [Wolbachia endosymbiont of Pentidionis agamae]|uniref:alpha/beta hydrolase n=1 Tax=Wolbachia endosymbiont of Pentidionis agamae TaxID=3110435 RepID=UPI002FD30E1C
MYHQSQDVNAPLALVFHHCPQQGGNMDYQVVNDLYMSFVKNNFSVLKINFRGVGKSTGVFDKSGIGELVDAAISIDWLQERNSNSNVVWAAGFSFGGWVAMQLAMRRPEVAGFIAISPPVTKYDFSFFSPCLVPGLIIQGKEDNFSEESTVSNLANRLINSAKSQYMQYHVVDGSNHFFRDTAEDANFIVDNYIKLRLSDSVQNTTYDGINKRVRRRIKEYA